MMTRQRKPSISEQAVLACRESEHRLAQIIDNCPVPMFVIDKQHRITFWNRASAAVSGIAADHIVGTGEPWRAGYDEPRPVLANLIVEGADVETIRTLYGEKCRPSPLVPGAWEALDSFRDGKLWIQFCASPLRGLDGQIVGAVEAFQDVTLQVQHKRELEHRTTHDGLTALPNRHLALDRLNQALKLAERSGHRVALMFLDLDGFKFVNDTLGHHLGDELLKQVAQRVQRCLREGDTLARLGGDEFIVLLPEQDNRDDAASIAERIVGSLDAPFRLLEQEVCISVSVGVALFPDDAIDAQSLLRHADAAMYRAKDGGRGNVVFFTGNLNRQLNERMAIKKGLAKALDRREFSLHFQPKCALASGRITGVEALLRWNSGELGMVEPCRFIPILEESGLIVDVGEWVIGEACRRQSLWQIKGYSGLRMAVNLSMRQLWQSNLPQRVARILALHDLDPVCLELELTESMIMREPDQTMGLLRNLSDLGVHLALDDFGTGYSSLSYLKRFPIHTIKIDRSFIDDLASDSDDLAIVRTIITMGRSLRRHIVAEGVETDEQRSILYELGCDEIQGYLLSPPIPAEAMERLLAESRLPRQAEQNA